MKKFLIPLLSLALVLMLSGCTEESAAVLSLSDADLSGTDEIRMQNAHNGHFTVISDPDDIAQITAFIQSVSGTDSGSGKGYYEGTYQLQFYREETLLFSIAFGDSDCFYTGKGPDGYPLRYLLPEKTVQERVIPFLSRYDESGFDWN